MGLNFYDILTLKRNQLKWGSLEIFRKKTSRAGQGKKTKIEIHVSDSAKEIIQKYDTGTGGYFFSFIDPDDKPGEIRNKVKTFTRNTNQALRKIAKKLGLDTDISTMFARHSAASHGIEGGASLAEIKQALGHNNIKTTDGYISSLKTGKESLVKSLEIKK